MIRSRRCDARGRVLGVILSLSVVLSACADSPEATAPAPEESQSPTASATPNTSAPSAAPATGDQPNILLIEADDMRADDLQWMPRTQKLLGEGGAEFKNSFAPNPLCCPSRASMLTGQHSHNHKVLTHEPPYGFSVFDDSDTLATRLQEVGYATGLVGKYLNGYGEQPTAGGKDSLLYVPPGWTDWRGSSDHIWSPGDEFTGGTYNFFNLTSNVNGEIETWPGEYTTDVTARQTREMIESFGDQPWFVWWNPVAPHHGGPVEVDDPGRVARSDGFEVDWLTPARPESVKGRFDEQITSGAGVPSVGSPEADVSDKPEYLRSYPEFTAQERAALTTVTRQRAETLHLLDLQVDRLIRNAELLKDGDTVVIFTSDNGYYLGEHRKRQGKINLHEPSVRVPLLMAGAGVTAGDRYDPATTLDVATTIAALGGTTLPAPDGIDLATNLTEGDQGWARPVVMEGLMPEPAYKRARRNWDTKLDTIGIRTARWKMVKYSTGEIELYDMWSDPLELESLHAAPSAQRVLQRMNRLWETYRNCAEDSCRAELPDAFVVGPQHNARKTTRALRAVDSYFR